jgi:hypothetical protein
MLTLNVKIPIKTISKSLEKTTVTPTVYKWFNELFPNLLNVIGIKINLSFFSSK